MEILYNFLYQLIFTVGVIVVFGLLITLCRKAFYKIVGENASKIIIATGIIGTPVHELSHALMCVVFGHKITEIKLYQPDSDGTLGYVNHSYNPRNLYHQIGNFFIGIAPILGGSGVIFLLMYLLVPGIFSEVVDELQFIQLISFNLFEASTYSASLQIFWDIVEDIFGFTNTGSILWWVFIVLSFMIASHMELSTADIKGGFKGFLFIAALLLIADIIMYFVSIPALEATTSAMTSFSFIIIGFLAIAGIFAGITVLLAFVIKAVIAGIEKIKNRG